MKLNAGDSGKLSLFFVISALLTGATQAVIVGGTLGTGNNNNDPAVLQNWLASNSYSSFGHWDNLVSVSNASGVYLGYNASTLTGWVLSAAHINPQATSITVGGSTYTVAQTYAVGSTDLILYEIGGVLGDPALPTLPTVPLAQTAATAGEFALMTGRGSTSATSAPYPWAGAGDMRWGTNVVEFNASVGGNSYIITDFDGTSPTAYEAQASVGDSGGGLFIYRNNQWILSGIAHFVDDGPVFQPSASGPVDPSEPGDFSGYTSVAAYHSVISGITGTLVPEPSAAMLLAGGAVGMLIRRRR